MSNIKYQIENKFIVLILLIILGSIPLGDLLHSGLPLTHDGQDHLARIANFYQSLSEGNIIPRWGANLNWGYGHPVLMFLYPLPSYLASLFHLIGFSLTDSLKLVFGIAFVASGIAMFVWIRSILGVMPGLVAGALYMYAPYRFVDLYVRGAVGEHVAFVFPPIILYFLYKLSKKITLWYVVGGSLSLALLIFSHNAIALMFLPFIVAYGGIMVWISSYKRKLLLSYLWVMGFGFGLSAFFLLPAFFEGKYTLRDKVTEYEYAKRFVTIDRFIYSPWNYGGSATLSVMVGFIHLAALIFSPIISFALYRKNRVLFFLSVLVFLYSIFSLFLMVSQSNFLYLIFTTLQKFQFPWRFMSTIVFTTSIMSALFVYLIKRRKAQLVTVTLIIFLTLFLQKEYWNANGYLVQDDSFFKAVYYGTTDTGESAPIWSVRFMEKEANANIQVIEGKSEIAELKRTSNEHIYKISTLSKTRILENTLYFPGWNVYIDGEKNNNIQFQDPKYRGLMTFFVEPGEHVIKIKFEETKLRVVANAVSIISLGVLILYICIHKKLNIKYQKNKLKIK